MGLVAREERERETLRRLPSHFNDDEYALCVRYRVRWADGEITAATALVLMLLSINEPVNAGGGDRWWWRWYRLGAL